MGVNMDKKEYKIEIKAVIADEISFVNRIEPGETIQLGLKYSYNILYSGGNSGRAEMTLTAESKTSTDKFRLKVIESGIFTCPEGLPREQVHVASFKALFPYAKALAAMVSAASGVPAVMIPEIELDAQDVMRIDFKPPKPDGGETPAD